MTLRSDKGGSRSGTSGAWLRALVAGLVACAAGAGVVSAQDEVELQDGSKVEGRVVFEDGDKVVVRDGSRDREIPRAKVKSVRSVMLALREVLDRWAQTDGADIGTLLDLARYCRSRGLEGEARLFAYLALTIDPSNEEAHGLCGHDKRGNGWVVRDGNRKHMFAELVEGGKDWRDAWSLTTTHYELTTNMSLASACALALELELFYRTFYDWFGADLGLYDVVLPMKCQVHADKASYPEEANGRIAYFDGGCNTLYELAVEGYVLDVLVHEATHQVLHNTTAETRSGQGDIPAWLHEGLAEYMAYCRTGDPAHARYDQAQKNAAHFACHRDAKKPYDLARILGLAAGDFMASSKADLKYAQAYTLVQFCLQGENQAHRPGFLEFLRSAYQGKSSATAFRSSLKLKERDLERAWNEYVKGG